MLTAATLTIDSFRTTLALSDDQPGPGVRVNILGQPSDGDWDRDHVSYFRNAADRQLTAHGYTRAGGWQYDSRRDVHTAPITPAN